MCKKDTRTTAEKIAHLERSVRKFGDHDGKLAKVIKGLRATKTK